MEVLQKFLKATEQLVSRDVELSFGIERNGKNTKHYTLLKTHVVKNM